MFIFLGAGVGTNWLKVTQASKKCQEEVYDRIKYLRLTSSFACDLYSLIKKIE